MTPEQEERFQPILNDFTERPGGDYAELLRRGRVVSPPDVDVEAWRNEIRASARKDRVRFATVRDGNVAIAITRREYTDQEVRRELERGERIQQISSRARELEHELGPWLRQEDESVAFCIRCDAHVYVRTSDDWVVDETGLSLHCESAITDP